MRIDDPEVETNLKELAQAFAATSDSSLIEAFLRSLLTPCGNGGYRRPVGPGQSLGPNDPQREIAKKFGLSLCKLPGSRELKKPDSSFKKCSSFPMF